MSTTKARLEIDKSEQNFVSGRVVFAAGSDGRTNTPIGVKFKGPHAHDFKQFLNPAQVEFPASSGSGPASAGAANAGTSADPNSTTVFEFRTVKKGPKKVMQKELERSLHQVIAEHRWGDFAGAGYDNVCKWSMAFPYLGLRTRWPFLVILNTGGGASSACEDPSSCTSKPCKNIL